MINLIRVLALTGSILCQLALWSQPTVVQGTVFSDANGNGRQDNRKLDLPGLWCPIRTR